MSNEERVLRRGQDIADRLAGLAASCIEIARGLPLEPAFRNVATQLVRAGTSAGANYEEARAAESRADFIHKVLIAAKEARETVYWLRLARIGYAAALVDRALNEASQLAAILGASARTARLNA